MDEDAIQRCFQHAVQSHHSDLVSPWKVPTVNVFQDWEPKVLKVARNDDDGDDGNDDKKQADLPNVPQAASAISDAVSNDEHDK